jgi:hypothetical protein
MKTKVFPPASQFHDLDDEATDSPAVKRVHSYQIDGQTFPTFAAAIESRENRIEALVRHLFRDSSPADQMKHVQWLLDNRAELRSLLDY